MCRTEERCASTKARERAVITAVTTVAARGLLSLSFDGECFRGQGEKVEREAVLVQTDELLNDRVAVAMQFDHPIRGGLGVGAPERSRVSVAIDGHVVAVPVVSEPDHEGQLVVVVDGQRLAGSADPAQKSPANT